MLLQGWRLFVATVLLACSVEAMAPSAVWADFSNPELAKALAYFDQGDYSRASVELTPLVQNPKLTPAERLRVHEALGISHYVLGRLLDARRDFNQLLQETPDYQPDSLFVPPEIIAFIVEIKSSMPPRAVTETTVAAVSPAPMPAPAPQPAAILPPKLMLPPATPQFSSLDLLPFGVGLFRKNYPGRGAAWLSMQAVFLGANVGLYYYRNCKLKESCSAPYYKDENVSKAQHLQTYQLMAGGLFVATAALGIADGFLLPVNESSTLSLRPVGSGVGFAWKVD